MQTYSRFFLDEIINTQILQEIQDKFSKATGLASVIVDAGGKPLTTPSNFSRLCLYIRSTPQGLARCMACDDAAGRKAVETNQPIIYHCHCGLTDLAAPIIVQNEYLGAFLAGQVVLPVENFDAKAQMFLQLHELELDNGILSDCYDIIEVVPKDRVKAAADLIYFISNYIVEIGIASITQKQLMAELKAKAELENMLRATELKALQFQVNPHFLFNTLNTIAGLALLEGAERTQEIVYSLSNLLRTNLRDIEKLRTLDEEVKSVQDYLIIQRVRFGDRIQAVIDIEPLLMETPIPALSLQPLVENAVIHGLEPKKDGGNIHIGGQQDGNVVILTISDTGVGMPEERIRSIFRAEKQPSRGQSTGIGILNVHRRIQQYFGDQFGLKIESRVGEGTNVFLCLPTR